MQVGNWKSTDKTDRLSPRELEAMLYAANDLSIKEIAREMNIEPTTVRARLDNARFKLGMQKTLRGLCMEAFKRGIIAPLSLTMAIALSAGPSTDYFRGGTDTNSPKNVTRFSITMHVRQKSGKYKNVN